MNVNMSGATMMYVAVPPVLPLPKVDSLSAERMAYNVKMNLMASGGVVPAVSPEGGTEMSNLIDTICACLVKELLMFGYLETIANTVTVSPLGTPSGPVIETGPIPTVNVEIPADGPGHVHGVTHTHVYPVSALKFR